MKNKMIEGFGNDFWHGIFLAIFMIVILYLFFRRLLDDQPRPAVRRDPNLEEERPPIYNPNCCPICLGEQTLSLETNCGHLYCGTCLHRHYVMTHGIHDMYGVNCAMCRQRVVLIFTCFTDEERENPADPHVRDEIVNFVRFYNRLLRDDLSLWERITELPVLLRHFVEDAFYGRGLDYFRLRFIVSMAITLIYLVIPFDMFPEVIYGIYGYAEDLVLIFAVCAYLIMFYRNLVENL